MANRRRWIRRPGPCGDTGRLREYAWFRRWPGFPPALPRGRAAPPCRKLPRRGLRTDSLCASLNRRAHDTNVHFHQLGGYLEAERVFGQETGFAVQVDVVAVILHGKASHFGGMRRATGGVEEFRLKIEVLGAIAGRIGVGDVRRHQFLPGAQQVHVSFELSGNGLQHGTGLYAASWPNGKSPEISRRESGMRQDFGSAAYSWRPPPPTATGRACPPP